MTRQRVIVLKILALASPFILLVVIELTLRISGYGHNLALFTDDPNHPGYLVMNQYASEKYFAQQQNATIGNFEPFQKKKTSGTFRIFVLGESTTIGYPYMHNGSFHRWLQFRLSHTFPDKKFEIINLSLTAVNSYTVTDFAKQIVDHQPDAVLVYTGHNEYYGALGVGSTSFPGLPPFLIKLVMKSRSSRLIQLIMNTLAKINGASKIDLKENLMKRMVSDQSIAYQSDKYNQGISQFESNMTELCETFQGTNIPLFISTIVSNEKDLKPFISKTVGGVSAQQAYTRGNNLYHSGQFAQAKSQFEQARELDQLRFRAPKAMNTFIKKLPEHYSYVHLVDADEIFRKNSPHEILGNETLLEHVHPNLFGYALLSDVFYNSLKGQKLITENWHNELSFDALRAQMPITPVDSIKAVFEMMMLKEGWPFNEPMPAEVPHDKTMEEQLAGGLAVKQITWDGALSELLKYYLQQKNLKGALLVNEAFTLEYPLDAVWFLQAGTLANALNQNQKAMFYLKKAFDLQNSFKAAQNLFVVLLKEDRPEEALPYLDYVLSHNESGFNMGELKNMVSEIMTLKQNLRTDTTNLNVANQIALTYLKFANTQAAQKYINKVLKADPKNKNANLLLEKIKSVGPPQSDQ